MGLHASMVKKHFKFSQNIFQKIQSSPGHNYFWDRLGCEGPTRSIFRGRNKVRICRLHSKDPSNWDGPATISHNSLINRTNANI